MAKFHKHNSKTANVFKIVLNLLKETCTFLFAITIGFLDIVATIFE